MLDRLKKDNLYLPPGTSTETYVMKRPLHAEEDANDWLFDDEDMGTLESQQDPTEKHPDQADTEKAIEMADSQNSVENYFHREGNGWRIGFQGEKGFFNNVKYIRCVSTLLEKPGQAITALEIEHAVDYNAHISECMSEDQALNEGLSFHSTYKDYDEISNNLLERLNKLKSDMETETDPLIKKENAMKYNSEFERITKKYCDPKTSRPRKQRLDDTFKKKSQGNVKKAIDRAYKAFEKAGLKKLAIHLKKNIKPDGNYDFRYRDTTTPWDIKS